MSFPHIHRVSFELKYPASDPNVLQIIEATLQFNPNRRPTIKELLAHPYFDNIRNLQLEADADVETQFEFEFIPDITRE
jgi:serine/threonine protein kinase